MQTVRKKLKKTDYVPQNIGQNRRIILASASPRRRMLLKSLGIKFKIVPSNIKEEFSNLITHNKYSPRQVAIKLAREKAKDVLKRYKNSKNIKNTLILGADTIVVLGKEILGKPKNKRDALKMLSLLSGKKHFVFTGLAVIDTSSKKNVVGCAKSTVWFKNLSKRVINRYINTCEPWDKAGAYAFQGKGRSLIASFSGPEDNIIGLPRKKLIKMINS